jgi:hypothetical protein
VERTQWGANPVYQCHQSGAISVVDGLKSQTHSAAGNRMPYNGFGANLSFRNKKIDLGFRVQASRHWRGKKQSTNAQIANPGNILDSFTSPADPDIATRINSGNQSSGIEGCNTCGCHSSPPGLWSRPRVSEYEARVTRLSRTIMGRLRAYNPANTLSKAQGLIR